MLDIINHYLTLWGGSLLGLPQDSVAFPIMRLLLLTAFVGLLHVITTYLLTPALHYFSMKTRIAITSYLIKHKFFLNLFRLIPLVLLQHYVNFVDSDSIEAFILKLTSMALILSSAILVFCIINALYDLLEHRQVTRNAPIRSMTQLLKVITVSVTLILSVATFIDKSPTYLLSGLGALSAVLLIVFKDPLVNFFAGLQISSQRLIKVGDWIEIEGVVDGTVTSINMVNCTIRGWSNQTHTVSLVKALESKNWRDMPNMGRHIKRTVYIDIDSIEFIDRDDIQRLSKFRLMNNYFENKFSEQKVWGEPHIKNNNEALNQREMTNVGCFRYYIKHYLQAHPKINSQATMLVRQLNPTQQGLPIQIYAFTNPENSGWSETEELASDIIDWVIAISKRFNIKIYQQPSQHGLRQAMSGATMDDRMGYLHSIATQKEANQ